MSDDRIPRAINAIDLSEDVPEDVVQRFDDVKSVLRGARENKRLVRVAVEYSVASFELSLRILCDRLGFEDAMNRGGKPFGILSSGSTDRIIYPVTRRKFLKTFRLIRELEER